jgi:hypothetical protein
MRKVMKGTMKEAMTMIFIFNNKQFTIYNLHLQKKKKSYCDLYRSNSLCIHILRASPGTSARKTAALLGMSEKRDASMAWSAALSPVSTDCAILIAVSMLASGVNPTCRRESTMVPSDP